MQTKGLAHTRLRHLIFGFLVGLALAAPQLVLAADALRRLTKPDTANEAPIEFWNRQIAVLRGTLAGADPQDRADRAIQRLNELPLDANAADIELLPVKVEDQDGIGFTYNGKVLFFLGKNDLDKEAGETLAQVSKQALGTLGEALEARRAERSWPVIRGGLLFSLVGFVLLVAAIVLVVRRFTGGWWRFCAVKNTRFPPNCDCSEWTCCRTSRPWCMAWCAPSYGSWVSALSTCG